MATPRKRYFRVADSIGDETWSNDELATLVRIMAALNTRWARHGLSEEEAKRATFGPGELMKCTGSASLARARRIFRALAVHVSLTLDEHGADTTITWPKFAEFQYIDTRSQGHARVGSGRITNNSAPPPLPRPASRVPQQEGEAPKALAPASPTPPSPEVRKSTKIPKPHAFTGEDRERIRAWASQKGFDSAALNAGLERFREWAPLKTQNRTISQWVGAFMRIVREGVEDGKIAAKAPPPGGGGFPNGGGSRYRSADSVLAEAKRKQAEDDEKARENPDDPVAVAAMIARSLRLVRPIDQAAEGVSA